MARIEGNDFVYQADWFSKYIQDWKKYTEHLVGVPNLNFLEVGSFEGRSTVWMLENVLTHSSSRITCVDTFGGSMEHGRMNLDTTAIEDTFWHNICLTKAKEKVQVIRGKSQEVLRTLPFETFDLAYIDGSHVATDVLSDAVLTLPLMKHGGVIIFDDYYWDDEPDLLNRPKMAIDAFLKINKGRYEMVKKYEQVAIRIK